MVSIVSPCYFGWKGGWNLERGFLVGERKEKGAQWALGLESIPLS